MTNTIEIYLDARRKFGPEDSLRYTICDLMNHHPLLKFHLASEKNNLVGNLLRSTTDLIRSIHDIEDFKNANIDKQVIISVQEIFVTSYLHLSHYLGNDCVKLFIEDFTQIPLFEIEYFIEHDDIPKKNKQLSFDFSL